MTAPTRSKYDTFIIWLYNQQKEHLLPGEFRKSIPYSTRSQWKNIDYASYTGSRFRNIQNESLEYYELFLKYKNLKKTVRIIARVWVKVAAILLPAIQNVNKHSEVFIDQVQRLFTVLPQKTVLRIAGLSAPAYYYRLEKIKRKCFASPLSLCFNRHPLQLAAKEIRMMKKLLLDERFACWPVASLAWNAKRSGNLMVSLSSWYKYSKLLGISRKVKKKSIKKKGIRASYPNRYLHVDTTLWELDQGVKAAIVFVSDSYSKAIIGWSVSLKHGAENVNNALQKAIRTIRYYHPDHPCATLIADGGSENHALTVQQLLEKTKQPKITKIVALKDIAFSNSPVEAINKIVKPYLRYYRPTTEWQLRLLIEKTVYDYSFIRPHHSLKGFTPMEKYTHQSPDMDFSRQIKQATRKRIRENRKNSCESCRVEE